MIRIMLAACAAALFVSAAQAKDDNACASGMVCASAPDTVVKALQAAGYKAALGLDDGGDPMIESAANGYNFTIFFYGCDVGIRCDSVQFSVNFEAEKTNTPELANLWNRKKRFLQLSVDDDMTLNVRYDLTTLGGVNQTNFADVIDWWVIMLGDLADFFDEHPDGA